MAAAYDLEVVRDACVQSGCRVRLDLRVLRTNDVLSILSLFFFFSSRRRHTRSDRDWSSDVCSSDLSSTGQPVNGSRFQLAVLDLLQRYDCLPSTYIKSVVGVPYYCKNVLKLLNQEEIGRASCRERV